MFFLLTKPWEKCKNKHSHSTVISVDVCLTGMDFWCLACLQGFHHAISDPSLLKDDLIFFKEAYVIVSILLNTVQQIHPLPNHISILTDSSNTVDLFNTLHAKPVYNPLLFTAIDLLLQYVSCSMLGLLDPWTRKWYCRCPLAFRWQQALALVQGLKIYDFTPPCLMLEAVKKWYLLSVCLHNLVGLCELVLPWLG